MRRGAPLMRPRWFAIAPVAVLACALWFASVVGGFGIMSEGDNTVLVFVLPGLLIAGLILNAAFRQGLFLARDRALVARSVYAVRDIALDDVDRLAVVDGALIVLIGTGAGDLELELGSRTGLGRRGKAATSLLVASLSQRLEIEVGLVPETALLKGGEWGEAKSIEFSCRGIWRQLLAPATMVTFWLGLALILALAYVD